MDVPTVRYAITSDDVRIAYKDFGEGPFPLVKFTLYAAVSSTALGIILSGRFLWSEHPFDQPDEPLAA